MKIRTAVGIAVLAVALSGGTTASAQPDEGRYVKYDFDRLMKAFDSSLRSEIPGVVESTIYNLVEYKSYFPGREYSKLVRALNEVSLTSRDSTIAFKASLAGMYLTYGNRIEYASAFSPYDHETAFKLVAEQLEKRFLISRSNQ